MKVKKGDITIYKVESSFPSVYVCAGSKEKRCIWESIIFHDTYSTRINYDLKPRKWTPITGNFCTSNKFATSTDEHEIVIGNILTNKESAKIRTIFESGDVSAIKFIVDALKYKTL